MFTQGSSRLATLGFETESLWDSSLEFPKGIGVKARDFTPEAAGKMNFHLSAVDDRFRQKDDQPSIGLILCRAKNRVIAEYALRDVTKPIGVSDYVTRLVETLPKPLREAIPSVQEIERGLSVGEPPVKRSERGQHGKPS